MESRGCLPKREGPSLGGGGGENWLENVLLAGRENGELSFEGDAKVHAQSIVSSFQGALLVAKSQRSLQRMNVVASHLVEGYRAR